MLGSFNCLLETNKLKVLPKSCFNLPLGLLALSTSKLTMKLKLCSSQGTHVSCAKNSLFFQ